MADTDADQEQLDDEPKSVILAMIKQLRYGMDLHKVTFPTFVLEPRSMLERVTDFLAHPELIMQFVFLIIPLFFVAVLFEVELFFDLW